MFSNRFNTKNDPLLEAAEAAMRDGDLRRQAEGIVNEAFGVYNRKAVVNEHLVDYDAAIEEVYAGLKEGVLDSIGSYLKNPTPTQKAVSGAAQGAVDKATGGMLGKLGSALSVGGSSAAPSGQTKNIREGKPNDGNLANNYPPYDKVTRGDVVAGRLGKDQMGGKRKMAEGVLDPKDPSVQGSGDVTSSARTSRPPVARKAPNDPSVQGSGDVTSRGKPVSVREEEQLDELYGKGKLPEIRRKHAGDYETHKARANFHNREIDKADDKGDDDKWEHHYGKAVGHQRSADIAGAKRKRASALMDRQKASDDLKTAKSRSREYKKEYKSMDEETQLDELKRSTLTSYIRKASRAKATPENISKRSKGLGLAAKKLEKLDELSAFGAEFAKQRAAGAKQFTFGGKSYTTTMKSPSSAASKPTGSSAIGGVNPGISTRQAAQGTTIKQSGGFSTDAPKPSASNYPDRGNVATGKTFAAIDKATNAAADKAATARVKAAVAGTDYAVPTINAPTTPVKKYAPSPAQQQAASDARNVRAGNSGVTSPTTTGSTGAKFAGTDAVSAPAGSAADMYGSRSIGGPRSSIPSGPTGERSTGQANITAPAPAAPKPAAKPLVKGNVSECVQIGDTKYRII